MGLFFNIYDLGAWLLIGVLTWWYGRQFGEWYHGCGLALMMFGVVLPSISSWVETSIVVARAGPNAIDSFNLWYTAFRYPVYWVLGIGWSAWVAVLVRRRGRPEGRADSGVIDDGWV